MARPLSSDEIDSAEGIFRDYLRHRGLKFTPERRALLNEVLGNDSHFEAEQMLIALRGSDRRVAKATVYRTLPLLVNCGILRQVQFGDKLTRYEHAFGHDAHDHMVCRRCRRIIEFDSAELAQLRTRIAAEHRFHAVSHRFQITGLCSECSRACPLGRARAQG
jgi:Fur family ferric uptake transcriptional regulator